MGQLTEHLVGAQKPFLRRSAHTEAHGHHADYRYLSQYQESGEAVMMLAGRASSADAEDQRAAWNQEQ